MALVVQPNTLASYTADTELVTVAPAVQTNGCICVQIYDLSHTKMSSWVAYLLPDGGHYNKC